MNVSDKMHVEALRKIIPELSEKLKQAYVQDGGENHWNI